MPNGEGGFRPEGPGLHPKAAEAGPLTWTAGQRRDAGMVPSGSRGGVLL